MAYKRLDVSLVVAGYKLIEDYYGQVRCHKGHCEISQYRVSR